MHHLRVGFAVVALAALESCNCNPEMMPDASVVVPPSLAWPDGALLTISATTGTSATLVWPTALGNPTGYRLTLDGTARDVSGTTETLTQLTAGHHVHATVIAVDAEGHETPALAAEVAPAQPWQPTDGDISTDFCGANAFTQAGNPIPCDEFSVLIGTVKTTQSSGVPGMRVSIVGHPEWGSTTSQADGHFALAVAAGRVTVQLDSTSFIPIQRTVTARAKAFTLVPDTAVLRRDEKATTLSTATGGFHSATSQQDKDGSRTTSVFVPPGTNAHLRFADGHTTPISTLTLRATEATVGTSGQQAMPATLPGATAYTFAADISADEALAAGAAGVNFETPVVVYADNFLHYPIGAAIPLGLYDEALGKWDSGPNAAVIAVVSGGVDFTGDGVADADFQLLPGEADALSHFAPGTQLVRSLVTHFSTFDTNSCWRCLGTCEENGTSHTAGTEPKCDCQRGSLIRIQNQTLSEYVHVSGTSLSLGWHSNRGNVRKPSIEMSLGLTVDGGMPMGVKGTYFRLEVAGQSIVVEHLDGGFGDTVSIPWDGLDVFGRPVRGPVAATASTGYGFGASALAASSSGGGATGVLDYSEKDFGVWPPPGARAMASTREAIFFLKHMSHSLGDWVPRENLGNLSLDILHGYSEDGTLHLGSGAHTTASESGPTVRLLAGGGTSFAEDAGWLGVDLAPFPYIAEGPQGIFFTENETRIRLLQNDGGVRTFSGDINGGFAGDGEDATRGVFNHVRSLATDRDGNLYINDVDNFRIRRIDAKTHILSTVVGTGTRGFSPDGTLAVDTQLDSVSTLLIGVDGLLYFITRSTGGSLLVRRVSDGVVKTVAGGNDGPAPTFEGDARGINLRGFPHWLAQSADGSLYIAGYDSGETSDWVVRRIDVSGRVHLVAGGGASRNPFETDARKTCLAGITGLAVSPEGTVFVGESGGGCAVRGPGVRMVTADGSLGLFFGGVTAAPTTHTPPDGAAASTLLSYLGEVIMGRRGKLLVIHRGPSTLHEVSLPTANAARLVPSQDGEEVYAFDVKGRHLKTVSARTGLVLWQFAWGVNGLDSMTDVDGDVTRVERNPDGSAKALVAQDGQCTELTLDAEGRVTRVTDAMGRFVEAAYFPRGLLREWKDENAHATTFEWDDAGNLVAETNARSGVKRLTKTNKGVDFTSAESRVTRYLQERGPGGFTHFVTAYPDTTQSTRSNDWARPGRNRRTAPFPECATSLRPRASGAASRCPAS